MRLFAMAWALSAAVFASPAGALAIEDCARPVATYGEEYGHTDLSGGLVLWGYRWTNQGTAEDLHLADCRSGKTVRARLMSHGMTEAIPYDRRKQAADAMLTFLEGSMAFLTLDRAATALSEARVPVERAVLTSEPCACAALYPGVAAGLTPFEAIR
jgi:hypothetical protein